MAEETEEQPERVNGRFAKGWRGGPGRKPIAEKYRPAIERAERVFAKALPEEAGRYIDELAAKEPEECPVHHRVLSCDAHGCTYESQRTVYDHKAAAYVFDRIMGKPTIRSENTLTVQFAQQLVTNVIAVFREVNQIDDPADRQSAFAQRLIALSDALVS